jgi:hypothetical protein
MNVTHIKRWRDTADWGPIPEYMHNCISEYVENGKIEDSFLLAIVTNDLKAACASADSLNKHLIFEYVRFFYNGVPSICWGGPISVKDWVHKGGLYGTGDEDEREHT